MTVYVDELRVAKATTLAAIRAGVRHGHRWCHLMADTEEELLAFGKLIGMMPSWLHGDHFDLTPPRRRVAVKMGAKEVTARELVELRQSKRALVPSES